MTPPATAELPRMNERHQKERRPVKKRYPAPPCPECESDNTEVTHTESQLRRFMCHDCDHRWKKGGRD